MDWETDMQEYSSKKASMKEKYFEASDTDRELSKIMTLNTRVGGQMTKLTDMWF